MLNLSDDQHHGVFIVALFVLFLAVQPQERGMLKAARTAVATVLAGVAIAWLIVSCAEPPPRTDAGADPEISHCCDWFFLPWLDSPQECLDDHTAEGECRWLTCLGGLVTYRSETCGR